MGHRLQRVLLAFASVLAIGAVALMFHARDQMTDLSERVTELERLEEARKRMRSASTDAAPSHEALPVPVASPSGPSAQNAPSLGQADAEVTILAFMDLASPFSARAMPTLHRVLEAYPDDVRVAFRHHPLPGHRDAPQAHRAAIAAGNQDRFWPMIDAILADHRSLTRARMLEHARVLALDVQRFQRDLDSQAVRTVLDRDLAEAERLELTTTPIFFVNGRRIAGAQPFANFEVLVERALASTNARRSARDSS